MAHARHKAAGLPLPAVFITAEQVAKGKPEPDPYLLGAERLKLSPADCVVVEDAPAGVIAGLSAGCAVIAVNAPDETPRLDDVALRLTSLASLIITRQPAGKFAFHSQP